MSNRLGRLAPQNGEGRHFIMSSNQKRLRPICSFGFGQCVHSSSAESRWDSAPPATSALSPSPAPRNVECPRCKAQNPALLVTMVLP